MTLENNQQAFFALVRAGLWEQKVQLADFGLIDFKEVYRLAQEQAVVGLVAAGFEHVIDIRVPPVDALIIAGDALELEHTNTEMNKFIGALVEQMRDADIYALLVKGQGIAQCYERPLWRACGDVDLLLNNENYFKAVHYLTPLASSIDEEIKWRRHLSMTIDPWEVELHGTFRIGLWSCLDKTIDSVQKSIALGNVRSWMNGKTQVVLPGVDEDVLLVFAHIIQHYYKEGIGLRQICDWTRLLWTYREKIDIGLLESRLKSAKLMSEWKAFACIAVKRLGMPKDAVPFYTNTRKWRNKADKIISFIFETGNFGHNRDYTYYQKYPWFIRKGISLWRHSKDSIRYFFVFPMDSIKVWCSIFVGGIKAIFITD